MPRAVKKQNISIWFIESAKISFSEKLLCYPHNQPFTLSCGPILKRGIQDLWYFPHLKCKTFIFKLNHLKQIKFFTEVWELPGITPGSKSCQNAYIRYTCRKRWKSKSKKMEWKCSVISYEIFHISRKIKTYMTTTIMDVLKIF